MEIDLREIQLFFEFQEKIERMTIPGNKNLVFTSNQLINIIRKENDDKQIVEKMVRKLC